ncbi:MAG: cupredoxin domain-containing protein [Alphaproteobacteria bacterium]|nr:cupredoxin domain-containing protein [Alphaproteobacteria bacterium]
MSISVRLMPIVLVAALSATVARADDDPVFFIEFANGAIMPPVLEVPTDTRFKMELRNSGSDPVEFESIELRKEKVLGPGGTSFIVIRRLDPGDYHFFDDFHPGTAPATLVARERADQ